MFKMSTVLDLLQNMLDTEQVRFFQTLKAPLKWGREGLTVASSPCRPPLQMRAAINTNNTIVQILFSNLLFFGLALYLVFTHTGRCDSSSSVINIKKFLYAKWISQTQNGKYHTFSYLWKLYIQFKNGVGGGGKWCGCQIIWYVAINIALLNYARHMTTYPSLPTLWSLSLVSHFVIFNICVFKKNTYRHMHIIYTYQINMVKCFFKKSLDLNIKKFNTK